MRKTLIALAALAASSAFAQVTTNTNSAAYGGTSATSNISGNGTSAHYAGASAVNAAHASGAAGSSPNSAYAATHADTGGATNTYAVGVGAGSANAGALQEGRGTATAVGTAAGGGANAGSDARVGTLSFSSQAGTSGAFANTRTNAVNDSFGQVNAGTGTTNASGYTNGHTDVTSNGAASPGASYGNFGILPGNAAATSNGYFGGSITRP
jgi:hypothetical protein